MALADDVAAALPSFCAEAESLMTDRCEVGTESTGGAIDEATGEYVPLFTPVYSGRCRFKAGTTSANEVDAAGQQLVHQDNTVSFPVLASIAIRRNMLVKITGSETDPGLVGMSARIKGPFVGSLTTARRFSVEVTS